MDELSNYFRTMGEWLVYVWRELGNSFKLQAVLIAYCAAVGLAVGLIMEVVR